MHGKLKGRYPYIYTEKTYMLYKDSEMISIKSVKDMDSSMEKVMFLSFILGEFSKHAKDSECSENYPDRFHHQFVFSHLTTSQ